MCRFAGACLLLLCEIIVLRLLPVFQSAHLLLIGFKFCVFLYVQGVYGVYLPLCVGVCAFGRVEARGGFGCLALSTLSLVL